MHCQSAMRLIGDCQVEVGALYLGAQGGGWVRETTAPLAWLRNASRAVDPSLAKMLDDRRSCRNGVGVLVRSQIRSYTVPAGPTSKHHHGADLPRSQLARAPYRVDPGTRGKGPHSTSASERVLGPCYCYVFDTLRLRRARARAS